MMMMRKLFLLLVLVTTCNLSAQMKMRDVFKQMPDSLVPYLDANNRLDFIDFIDSGMLSEVTNSLGGKSVMQKLTDDALQIQLTESSSLSMRLLDVSEQVDSVNQIVCFIRTYGSDLRESQIAFYSVKWRQLPTEQYLTIPDGTWTATLKEEELVLTPDCKLEAPANEEQEIISKPSIILKWKDRFVKQD